MGTIRTGDNETHILQAGHVLTVTAPAGATGTVWRYAGPPCINATASKAVPAGAVTTVGPFQDVAHLRVSCATGILVASIGAPSYPATLDAEATATIPTVNGNVTLFGDSQTQYGDTDQTIWSHASRGWFHWYNYSTGGQLHVVANRGIAGNTLDNFISRMTTVAADDSELLFFMGTGNSFDLSASDMRAKYITLLDYFSSVKTLVVAQAVVPRINTTAVGRTYWMAMRDILGDVAARYSNVIFSDAGANALADPVTKTGVDANYIDGTHLATYGAEIMGNALAKDLRGKFVVIPKTVPTSQLLPAMTTTTGGTIANTGSGSVTGTMPAGYTLEVAGTASVTITHSLGAVQLAITTTSTAGSSAVRVRNTNSVHSALPNGTRFRSAADVFVAATAGTTAPPAVSFRSDSTTLVRQALFTDNSPYASGSYSHRQFTPIHTASNQTGVFTYVAAGLAPSASVAMSVRNLAVEVFA